jgi:Zn-dependent peptidase ImmA (M78 family)/DNA-binding XRE family transcriptional regulator
MIGARIQRARKAAGLAYRPLAGQLGLSHTTLSKFEKGELTPDSAQLLRLAQALGVRTEYFFRPDTVSLEGVEYRKHSTLAKKALRKIEADILDQAERWFELLGLFPSKPIPDFAVPKDLPAHIDGLDDAERMALALRKCWQLGLNAIPNMTDLLESKGIIVIASASAEAGKFDGLCASVNGTPVIVTQAGLPGDRQRFTLAHELGHLLMQGRLRMQVDEEKACHRFAGAFLLPARETEAHLGSARHQLEIGELHLLKHEFGISMRACLARALQAGILNESAFKRMQIKFNIQGWHKCEPGNPCLTEVTRLYEQLVYRALGEELIGESKAAELLGMSVAQFHRQRMLGHETAGQ